MSVRRRAQVPARVPSNTVFTNFTLPHRSTSIGCHIADQNFVVDLKQLASASDNKVLQEMCEKLNVYADFVKWPDNQKGFLFLALTIAQVSEETEIETIIKKVNELGSQSIVNVTDVLAESTRDTMHALYTTNATVVKWRKTSQLCGNVVRHMMTREDDVSRWMAGIFGASRRKSAQP